MRPINYAMLDTTAVKRPGEPWPDTSPDDQSQNVKTTAPHPPNSAGRTVRAKARACAWQGEASTESPSRLLDGRGKLSEQRGTVIEQRSTNVDQDVSSQDGLSQNGLSQNGYGLRSTMVDQGSTNGRPMVDQWSTKGRPWATNGRPMVDQGSIIVDKRSTKGIPRVDHGLPRVDP